MSTSNQAFDATSPEQMAVRAAEVLRENDLGGWTKAAPRLYPHQWSWDSAFIAIGLARLDTRRAAQELRMLFTATAVPSIAARIPGRWNGSFASGTRRPIRGRRRSASSIRAGPRRIGFVTSAPRSVFASATTFNVSSGSRTAQAHDVGPWTRTPFGSAIPPNRIF